MQCAANYSPYLEATGEGICTLDLRGRAGESDHEPWARQLIAQVRALRLYPRIGVAATPELALQNARLARPFLQTAGELLQQRRPPAASGLPARGGLPLAALEPEPGLAELLEDWGVRTVADFSALPREAVGERLGSAGLELWDRAAGRGERVLNLWRPTEIYEETVELEYGAETLEPLLFLLRRLLEQVCARLACAYLLAAGLTLTVRCEDGQEISREIPLAQPTPDVEVLFRVLGNYLDTLQTPSPVVGLTLAARPSPPLDHQFGFFQTSLRNPNGFAETLGRLTALLGQDRVGMPQRQPSHRPDAFTLRPPAFLEKENAAGKTQPTSVPRPGGEEKEEENHFSPAAGQPGCGPALRRYRPPLAAEVEVASSPPPENRRPLAFSTGEARGRIARAAGPWRASGEWWEVSAWGFEEWDVEVSGVGGLYRLAHDGRRWWLVGVYG